MRLEQLGYLAALTRFDSLRQASAHLHLSQPALSEALGNLERELGVSLLDRRRSGTRISDRGRELLTHVHEVIDAAQRLREAATEQTTAARSVRVGTVLTAAFSIVVPAVRDLRAAHPATTQVVHLQQDEIYQRLREGTLDLGLVNLLEGDDPPHELVGTELASGRPVVVLPADHRLAAREVVEVADLRAEPYVEMRAGYLMHRFAHRLFAGDPPDISYSADGAEFGKLMVAEGLGLTLLPDFSVIGDPMERTGILTHRPLATPVPGITMMLCHRHGDHRPQPVRALHSALVRRGRAYMQAREGA